MIGRRGGKMARGVDRRLVCRAGSVTGPSAIKGPRRTYDRDRPRSQIRIRILPKAWRSVRTEFVAPMSPTPPLIGSRSLDRGPRLNRHRAQRESTRSSVPRSLERETARKEFRAAETARPARQSFGRSATVAFITGDRGLEDGNGCKFQRQAQTPPPRFVSRAVNARLQRQGVIRDAGSSGSVVSRFRRRGGDSNPGRTRAHLAGSAPCVGRFDVAAHHLL